MRPSVYLPQRARLVVGAIYLGGILVTGSWALGWLFPPFGIRGLWFYSAAAAIVLGEFVLEPFFTRPADALANGATLLLTAASVSPSGASVSADVVRIGRIIFIVYAAIVLILGVATIWTKDASGWVGRLARPTYGIVGTIGRARWLFGAVYFAAVYAAFSDSSGRVAILYLAWILIFAFHPLERALRGDRRRAGLTRGGSVVSLEDPQVVVVKLPTDQTVELGQRASIDGHAGTVVDTTSLAEAPLARVALAEVVPVTVGAPVELSDAIDTGIVGHVGVGTTIDDLVVATSPVASDRGLEEGRLVAARIAEQEVLFQITRAGIKRETGSMGDRDLIEFEARKLGIWDPASHGFSPVGWVPSAGHPVKLFQVAEDQAFNVASIGHVPGTDYGVQLDLDAAVTHNTAILGILGIGKTHLAWEIMKRLLLDGKKVVALDITGRYAREFASLDADEYRQALEARIEVAIAPTRSSIDVHDNEAGNIRPFRAAISAALRDFYDGDCCLLVINPLNFDVTKMEGRPTFSGTAVTLSRLTMVEITRIVTEALLEISIEEDAQDPNLDERARLALILEEAHSLVPEWNAATGDAEKWAVNGTARAVLQGRKYGFGCLLITQRTASVTKSILNQCNTIFALRAYDATGAGFLENYIGSAYAPMLASLKERQAVVFGRASSCAAPIVVRLNDAAQFAGEVWIPRREELHACDPAELNPPTPAVTDVPVEEGPSPELDLRDDDIPF